MSAELSAAPSVYRPRACDCDFCCKHGAAWVSDPKGSLLISINDTRNKGTYRQGSKQADFLVCRLCGVLVAVIHRDNGRLYAAVNAKVLEAAFSAYQSVSPQRLSGDEKVKRWKDVWFSSVKVDTDEA